MVWILAAVLVFAVGYLAYLVPAGGLDLWGS